ncbi:MAG: hypothetical protein R2828_35300 [Saprospiraceae bacterium]
MFEQEGIEWEGKPNPKFSLTLFELGGHYDVMTGATSILGFVFGGMLIFGYVFYRQGNWVAFALTMIIGLAIIVIPDILKHERKKHTQYAFTKNRVFFQLWWWGKKSIHFIDFADVGQITYEEYGDKSGVLHFLPKTPFNFFTHDFETGKKRFYPTFEMIPNVVELQKKLEIFRIERIRKKAAEG